MLRQRHDSIRRRPEGTGRKSRTRICSHSRSALLHSAGDLHGLVDHTACIHRRNRYVDTLQSGVECVHGSDILYHESAQRSAAAGSHDGLLDIPVAQLRRTAARAGKRQGRSDVSCGSEHVRFYNGQLAYYSRRLPGTLLHDFHAWKRPGYRNGKGRYFRSAGLYHDTAFADTDV